MERSGQETCMSRVRKINLDDPQIAYLCGRDCRLAYLMHRMGALEYARPDDPFKFVIEEIIGQMLSNKAAAAISARLESLCRGNVCAQVLLNLPDEALAAIGISKPKCGYIKCFAGAVASGDLALEELPALSDVDVLKKLTSVRGIGAWTSKMYLLFVLEREDVIPAEDVAFLRAFQWLYGFEGRPSVNQVMAICELWRPYSSYAARYLYKALDSGLTKEEIAWQA